MYHGRERKRMWPDHRFVTYSSTVTSNAAKTWLDSTMIFFLWYTLGHDHKTELEVEKRNAYRRSPGESSLLALSAISAWGRKPAVEPSPTRHTGEADYTGRRVRVNASAPVTFKPRYGRGSARVICVFSYRYVPEYTCFRYHKRQKGFPNL